MSPSGQQQTFRGYEGLAGTLRAIADAIDACCPAGSATKQDIAHG